MFKRLLVLSQILIRFSNEIISGVWAILVFIPLDSYLYTIFEGEPSYKVNIFYWIFFTLYTIFFLVTSALVPYLKEMQVNHEIERLFKFHKITYSQKKKIENVLKDVFIYKTIFSKEGLLQFIMTNTFCLGIVLAYFGIEGFITNIMFQKTLIVPSISVILFFVILTAESLLDSYLSSKIKRNQTAGHIRGLYGQNKNLITLILRSLGSGGSLSSNISQIIIEEAVDDICEILHISSYTEGVAKKIKTQRKKISKDNSYKTNPKGNLKRKYNKRKVYSN